MPFFTANSQVPDLPAKAGKKEKNSGGCGPIRTKKRHLARAAVLIALHIGMVLHFAHWKVAGETVTPLEPSEAMQTLELGYVNAGFILFAFALLSTLIFGRYFCGWACHVVAYQDASAWFLGKLGLRPKPVRARLLVYVPMAVALYMFVWPSVERLFVEKPAIEFTEHFTTNDFWATFSGPWIALLTLFVCGGLLIWFMGSKGFCTYGCPYGAFFGIADKVSPGRIRVTDACEGCGHCTAVCTSNVRVHEEVKAFGHVVDAGCMKCMDCVSVCPKDALYFGFGTPQSANASMLARGRVVEKPKKRYDFELWEEFVGLAVGFGAMWAFRAAYDKVPFFLAIGLGAVAAMCAIFSIRALRQPSVRMQRYDVKRAGKFTTFGATTLPLFMIFLSFTVHTGVVKWHTKAGNTALELASQTEPKSAARQAAVEQAEASLLKAEKLGFFPVAVLEQQLGEIAQSKGEMEEAKRRMNRSLEIDPDRMSVRWWLHGLKLRDARKLLGSSMQNPDWTAAKAGLRSARATTAEALAQLQEIVKLDAAFAPPGLHTGSIADKITILERDLAQMDDFLSKDSDPR